MVLSLLELHCLGSLLHWSWHCAWSPMDSAKLRRCVQHGFSFQGPSHLEEGVNKSNKILTVYRLCNLENDLYVMYSGLKKPGMAHKVLEPKYLHRMRMQISCSIYNIDMNNIDIYNIDIYKIRVQKNPVIYTTLKYHCWNIISFQKQHVFGPQLGPSEQSGTLWGIAASEQLRMPTHLGQWDVGTMVSQHSLAAEWPSYFSSWWPKPNCLCVWDVGEWPSYFSSWWLKSSTSHTMVSQHSLGHGQPDDPHTFHLDGQTGLLRVWATGIKLVMGTSSHGGLFESLWCIQMLDLDGCIRTWVTKRYHLMEFQGFGQKTVSDPSYWQGVGKGDDKEIHFKRWLCFCQRWKGLEVQSSLHPWIWTIEP